MAARIVVTGFEPWAHGVENPTLEVLDQLRASNDIEGDLTTVLRRHKPGDTIAIVYVDRSGAAKNGHLKLGEDPHIDVLANGAALTPAQKAFRERWLGSKVN